MRPMKIAVVLTAALTLGVFAAACSSSKSMSNANGAHIFDSGVYSLTIAAINTDSCFAGIDSVLVNQSITVQIVSTSDTAWELIPPAAVAGIIPPFQGTQDGNTLDATGATPYFVNTACSLAITATVPGTLTADDEFSLDLNVNLSAMTTASNGLPSNCASMAGQTLPGGLPVPFPTLDNATNGSCALSIHGNGTLSSITP